MHPEDQDALRSSVWNDMHEAAARAAMRERNERTAADAAWNLREQGAAAMADELGVDIGQADAAGDGDKQFGPIGADRPDQFTLRPRPVDQNRLEALRLAAANGGNHEEIVAAAEAFLAFLDRASVTPRVPDGLTIDPPTRPGTFVPVTESELPPYLAAEVDDVVEVKDEAKLSGDATVLRVDNSDELARLFVWFHGSRLTQWVANEKVKRIVRKASETGK